jgi:phage portal protein BeeE
MVSLDLDAVPALAEERERTWARIGGAEFLSTAEKRALVGITE